MRARSKRCQRGCLPISLDRCSQKTPAPIFQARLKCKRKRLKAAEIVSHRGLGKVREPRTDKASTKDRGKPRSTGHEGHARRSPPAETIRSDRRNKSSGKDKPAPRPRKYISALRAEEDAPAKARAKESSAARPPIAPGARYTSRQIKREDKRKPTDREKPQRSGWAKASLSRERRAPRRRASGKLQNNKGPHDGGRVSKKRGGALAKAPRAQKPSAPGTPYANAGRAPRLAQPFRKDADEGGRRNRDGRPETPATG